MMNNKWVRIICIVCVVVMIATTLIAPLVGIFG